MKIIIRKKKSFVFRRLILVALMSGFCWFGVLFTVTAADREENVNINKGYLEVIVKEGDTLWDLARNHYHGKKDIRKKIYEIRSINNLETVNIVPGQLILIPQ